MKEAQHRECYLRLKTRSAEHGAPLRDAAFSSTWRLIYSASFAARTIENFPVSHGAQKIEPWLRRTLWRNFLVDKLLQSPSQIIERHAIAEKKMELHVVPPATVLSK